MADFVRDKEKYRYCLPDNKRDHTIPFIDFLLCCYIYIDDDGLNTNNKHYAKPIKIQNTGGDNAGSYQRKRFGTK